MTIDDKHQQAFEVYASCGTKRTFTQVAEQLGVSDRTVRHWAKEGKWRQRLAEREVQAARQAADQVIGSSVAHAARNRKMVELALMKVIKAINSDKVKIQVGDLDRLLRLQAFLDGDGVLPTPEALRERPFPAVFAVFTAWVELLTDEELHMMINWRNPSHLSPQAAAPATDAPPTQGEVHDPVPNPAD